MDSAVRNERTARAAQRLLSGIHLLLAVAAFVSIWVQRGEWPFPGRLAAGASWIRSTMTPELRFAAVVLGCTLVVLLVVRLITRRAKTGRVILSIASAVAVVLFMTVSMTPAFLLPADMTNLRPDYLLVIMLLGPYIALIVAVGVSPLAVGLVGAANALLSRDKNLPRCEAAADAVTACIIPLMLVYLVLPPLARARLVPEEAPKPVPRSSGRLDLPRRLALAAARGDGPAVRAILKNGASPDESGAPGYTPLIVAVVARPPLYGDEMDFQKKQLDVVDALLQAGADASRKDPTGKSALDHAKERGLVEIANRLAR